MADRQSETAPLLPHNVYNDELATPNNSRLMRLATVMSLVTGLLTLAFLVASMGIMSRAPSQYYPPYELYYSFAPIAGFVSTSDWVLRSDTGIDICTSRPSWLLRTLESASRAYKVMPAAAQVLRVSSSTFLPVFTFCFRAFMGSSS